MSVFTRLVRFRRSLFGSGYKTFQTVLLLTIALSLISLINLAVEIKENKCRKELRSESSLDENDDGMEELRGMEEVRRIKSSIKSNHKIKEESKHKEKEEKEARREAHSKQKQEPAAEAQGGKKPPVDRKMDDDDDEPVEVLAKIQYNPTKPPPPVHGGETRGLDSLEPRLKKIVEEVNNGKEEIVTMTEPNCGCKKQIAVHKTENEGDVSLCSEMATKRGPHQRVNSISFWGSFFKHPNRAHRGLGANVYTIPEFYPGWIFRLYTDITPETMPKDFEVLCNMTCSNDNMDLCLMQYIPGRGDSTNIVGQFWRFLPLMDPLVDVFVSRDADSKASHREAAAVYDWLAENKTFHIMRDAPGHMGHKILAGMWGADNRYKRKSLAKWGRDLIDVATGLPKKPQKTFDQEMLDKYLWPHIENDSVQHDAYGCLRNPNTRPWPTKRETTGWNFVGSHESINNIAWKECPIQCRHPDHKNEWYNC